MIEIKNAQNYKGPGEYIGRKTPTRPVGSPLANVFKMKTNCYEERIRVIKQFRQWLHAEFKREHEENTANPAMEEIYRLCDIYARDGKLTLICWCYPNPCHGEVIANCIRYLKGEALKPYSWK